MPKKILINDEFRTNELSLTPGGNVVTVVYENGDRRVYDKIKNVDAYVGRITKDSKIIQVWCETDLIWKR